MGCFVVYLDVSEGRLDPHYYQPEYRKLNEKIKKTSHRVNRLEQIGKVVCGPFGSAIKVNDYVPLDGVPLIRIQNIKDGSTILNDNCPLVFIPQELSRKLKGTVVTPNDIVVSQRGTLGEFAIVPDDFSRWNISANLIAVRDIKLNSKYLIRFLSIFGKDFMRRSMSGQVQPKITTQDIKNIPIVVPSQTIQNQIIDLMDAAYKNKDQKEAEAQKLLDSIDNYLLEVLGITLPELKDEMCFVVYLNEGGGRLDSYYYQPKFVALEEALEGGNYEIATLKETFSSRLVKGILPKDEDKNGNVRVLQIRNIRIDGLIDVNEALTAKNIFSEEHKLNRNDVIIVITGATIGKVGLWEYDVNDFYLGGDMVKFSTKDGFNPLFIKSFLLSPLGQFQINKNITGATNKHLSPSDVELFKIPLLPIEVQNEIAEEVQRRIKRAQQLRAEAIEELERAKQEVERIIGV